MKRSIINILKADFFCVLKSFASALILVAILFLYFRLALGFRAGFMSAMLYFQLLFIYHLSMDDVMFHIPAYIGMSCTRKSVDMALWLRWCYLFLLIEIIFGAGLLMDFGVFKKLIFLFQMGFFMLILGFSTIISILRYYNKWFSTVAVALFCVAVGVFTSFMIESNAQETLFGFLETMNPVPCIIVLLSGILLLLVAAVVRNRYLKRMVVI